MKTTKLKPVITKRKIWVIKRVKDGKYACLGWTTFIQHAWKYGTKAIALACCDSGEIPVHFLITDKTVTTIREIGLNNEIP